MKRILPATVLFSSLALIATAVLAQMPLPPQPPTPEQLQLLQRQLPQIPKTQESPPQNLPQNQHPPQSEEAKRVLQQQGAPPDIITKKIVQYYESLSCTQVQSMISTPKPEPVREFAKTLDADAKARAAFINKVAVPITTKLFDCGIIP